MRRAVFGDFTSAASHRLSRVYTPPAPGQTRRGEPVLQVDELIPSLRRVLTVMSRYCADAETAIMHLPGEQRPQMRPWLRAASRSREALDKATAELANPSDTLQPVPTRQPGPPARPPGPPARSLGPSARALTSAAAALILGRDLLHTHTATRPDGTPSARSEWGPVLTSAPLTRALIHQVGSWAHQLAPIGGQIAVAGAPVRGTPHARRKLNAACRWLWVLDWAVQAAHEQDPVPAADLRLLHAIPVNGLQPRQLPAGTEPVTSLCHGTITTAARLRHHARQAIPPAAWSPDLTMESLRETALYATVTSHNCQVILRTLTDRAAQQRQPHLHTQLAEAAAAAGQARSTWLHATRAWDTIITDTRRTLAPAATDTADLALWTGRLAYADPAWTPDMGPAHTTRAPDQLAPREEDLTAVVTAVHHACETLTQVAEADHSQLTTASMAG